MGAWGPGSFENDAALDWVLELNDAEDATPIDTALMNVADAEDEYLDVDEASEAIAAAEVVAALAGRPAATLPEAVTVWVSASTVSVSSYYIDLATHAVAKVRTNSELQGLWDESPQADEWYQVLDDLEARLKE